MSKHIAGQSRIAMSIVVGWALTICAGLQAQADEPESAGASKAVQTSSGSSVEGIKNLIGTWNLTGESQFGPMEHKLVVAGDGKVTYESSGQTSEVTNIKIDGDKISFEMTVFGGGNSYDVAFEGAINEEGLIGDILTGGTSFATLKAPRAPSIKNLIGTWNLTGESRFGPMEHKLVVAIDGKATYESSGQTSEVSNLKVEGDKVSFEMTTFGGGNSYDVAFAGTLNEGGLTGDILTGGTSFATLKAPRAPSLKNLIGTWNLTGESQYGPLAHKLVVAAEGKVTYESSGQTSQVTNLKIEGEKVSFEMTIFGGGNSYDVAFEGTLKEEGLTGDILTRGTSFAALKAKRE